MTESSNKPIAEQIYEKWEASQSAGSPTIKAGWLEGFHARDSEFSTRDLAVEAAAYEKAAVHIEGLKYPYPVQSPTGMRNHLVQRVRALITPAHTLALAAHDRELLDKSYSATVKTVISLAHEAGIDVQPTESVVIAVNNIIAILEQRHAAHDREREDRMLKRFEELAGKLRIRVASSTTQNEAVYNHCAEELLSTIASIRKDRE